MQVAPLILAADRVRLEPPSLGHHGPLCEFGLDPAIWDIAVQPILTSAGMQQYIAAALAEQAAGASLPFATIDIASGRAIGSTRFMNIDRAHRRVEIGHTWLAPAWQRTAANTQAKYLMLRHAFETLGCIRVEFKTDSLNQRSRAAIQRLGAKEEGVFRNHMITHSGRFRHSVFFSIIDADWPGVKAGLEARLRQPAP